jgi:membrane-bound lytic murein transglycosylase D
VVVAVAAVGLVVAAVMGTVIWIQQREIARLISQKQGLDADIAAVQQQMARESDPEALAGLEARLGELTGSAQAALGALAEKDVAKAKELEEAGDELDRAIRRILAKFDADTYAVPPVFKEALAEEIKKLSTAGNLRAVYARRNRHWPLIVKEFASLGLPEEMAYIAWAETQFDADAVSPAGAKGMWQMTSGTARELGLVVDAQVDERVDVAKQTRAAARKLAALLAEFGSDSFMLALASYNRGEFGVRRALREVAKEKDGFRKEKRDFWHLYRMKKLPEETRDYVPRVLAAAVVCGDAKRYGLE